MNRSNRPHIRIEYIQIDWPYLIYSNIFESTMADSTIQIYSNRKIFIFLSNDFEWSEFHIRPCLTRTTFTTSTYPIIKIKIKISISLDQHIIQSAYNKIKKSNSHSSCPLRQYSLILHMSHTTSVSHNGIMAHNNILWFDPNTNGRYASYHYIYILQRYLIHC